MLFSATQAIVQALQPVHDAQVDRHPPLVPVVLVVGIHREGLRRLLALLLDDCRLVPVFLERGDADRRAPFHQVMFLRRRERVAFAGLRNLEAVAEPRRIGRAEQERVERLGLLRRGADVAGHPAAVSEEHRDRLLRMTGHAEDRHPRGVAAVLQLDDVAVVRGRGPSRAAG